MNSILFTNRPLLDMWEDDYIPFESILDDCIFEDSKLRKICEKVFDSFDEADFLIDILKYVPTTSNIYQRQEVFTEIKNNKNKYDDLLKELTILNSKYESLKKCTDYLKKRLLFTFYINSLNEFINQFINATDNTEAKLLKDLNNEFKKYLDNNKSFFKKAKELNDKISNNLRIKISFYQGSNILYIDKEFEEKPSIEETIDKIASLLNIDSEVYAKNVNKREISNNYLSFLLENKENKKLLEEISDFREENRTEKNKVICLSNLEKELKYYIKVCNLVSYFEQRNIPFTKSQKGEKTIINNCYDISLLLDNIIIIPNDFVISEKENIQFILGVNSGGKTCYLRSVILAYLFHMMVGYSFSNNSTFSDVKYLFTHFPNEESYKIGEGRLIDERNRLRKMEEVFSPETIVFMNETFSSTTEEKACELTLELIDKVEKTKANIVFVTHQYRIFEIIKKEEVVYLTPEVVLNESGNIRTHKMVKVEKGLLSYAQDILIKHGLTKEDLLRRRKQSEK